MDEIKPIDLSGEWNCVLDREDLGLREGWFRSRISGNDSIVLPGSLNQRGMGDIPTVDMVWTGSIYDRSWYHDPELKEYREACPPFFPFWLTPNRYYVGVAWYERTFEVSKSQSGHPFIIFLERPHWQTRVWLDSVFLGSSDSLSVPHLFEGAFLDEGTHTITIRVDNRVGEINPGPDAHSISDHTQGNWNGIVGRMEIRLLSSVRFQSVKIYTDIPDRKVFIDSSLQSSSPIWGICDVLIFHKETPNIIVASNSVEVTGDLDSIRVRNELVFDSIELWDEFHPHLYKARITFSSTDGGTCRETHTFGFRDFAAQGTRFCINGRALFLRGNVDCCVFPETGYPPTAVDKWLDVYRALMANGVNHVRFHSWCPPEAAFDAADRLGLYLQIEAPCWPNHGSSIGDGDPIDTYIYQETERILDRYGNHPSFVMYAAGNEPYGSHHVDYLKRFVAYCRALDARRLYTGASVGTLWPIVPETDFIVHSRPRGLPWDQRPQSLFDYSAEIADQNVPFVAHEMGQFCVFPDFSEIESYQGVYRARNLEMFRARFRKHFSEEKGAIFHDASGQLQTLCYKAEIEASLRTPGFAGIQLLGLNDFPGQGTALIGVMNAFYQNKNYCAADRFRRFFNTIVPLARFEKFVFRNDEELNIGIEVANFSAKSIPAAQVEWSLFGENNIYAKKSFFVDEIPTGKNTAIEKITLNLDEVKKAEKLTFTVTVCGYCNQWNLWVYPAQVSDPRLHDIIVCETLNEEALRAIELGKDLLLLVAGNVENGKDVIQYFRPAFWNTSWFQMNPPHTLGLSIDKAHPIFENFPTDRYSDYQWWELVQEQQVANLEFFPDACEPMVQAIDTWFINRRLGLLFECIVGESRIVVCTADLVTDWKNRPVAQQLYESIIGYMRSEHFTPGSIIDISILGELFEKKERKVYDVMTDDKPDELIPVHTIDSSPK
jgi:hypothetical protein